MNQEALQDVVVSTQMRTSHPTRLIEVRKRPLGEFRPAPPQAPSAGAPQTAAIAIEGGLRGRRVGPIAPTAIGFRNVRPYTHCGQVRHRLVAVVPLVRHDLVQVRPVLGG